MQMKNLWNFFSLFCFLLHPRIHYNMQKDP